MYRLNIRPYITRKGLLMKQAGLSIRMDKEEKERLAGLAKEHGISLTELLLKGGSFYGSFPPEFFSAMQQTSKEMGLSTEAICMRVMLAKVAADAAWLAVFDKAPPGVMAPFQWENGRLIGGDQLSKILFAHYQEVFQKLKDNILKAADGEELRLTDETAYELMTAVQ